MAPVTVAPIGTTAATMLPAAAPRYVYPAASAEVPVYGSSVAVPQLYQQPGVSMPTVTYSQAQPMSNDQLKAIFPMGAPTSFTPFTASQYTYNIVDSPSVFIPATATASPVATMTTVPPTTAAPVATVPTTEIATSVAEQVTTEVAAPASAQPAAPLVPEASSKKKSSSKKSKKLSSKKKQKGCC